MVSERLSLTKLLFLGGLYIACLSAILSSTLGTSRVVQGITSEGLIPQMSKLLQEDSPHKDPLKATVLVTAVAVVLVLLGNLNQMAILSSMPFLLTYAFVNYAYVSLAMSDDLDSLGRECSAKNGQQTNYGSVHEGLDSGAQRSLDALFSSTEEGAGGNGWHGGGGQKPWYTRCINRYVSFAAAIVHLLMLFFINQLYALLHMIAFVGLYLYLGKACPAVSDQGVSHFSILHMLRVAMAGMEFTPFGPSNARCSAAVPPAPPQGLIQPGDIQSTRLNEQNPDYAQRKQYHHAEQLG
uniref:Amino acid permease/ SLC12A domain-containing protein n=1 Tax=Globodera rostochiensis TaxID=31243 RepID=A0A914IAJ3_GLORO